MLNEPSCGVCSEFISFAAENAKGKPQHADVCSNVTGRTKEMIAQKKRARPVCLAIFE